MSFIRYFSKLFAVLLSFVFAFILLDKSVALAATHLPTSTVAPTHLPITTYQPAITESPPVGGNYISYVWCVFRFTNWIFTNEYTYRSPSFIQFEIYIFEKMKPQTSKRGIRIYGFRLSHCESGSIIANMGMNVAVNSTFNNVTLAAELNNSAIEAFEFNVTVTSVDATNPILLPLSSSSTVAPVLEGWMIAIIVIIIVLLIGGILAIIFGLRYCRNKTKSSLNANGPNSSVELEERDDDEPYEDFKSTSQTTFSKVNKKDRILNNNENVDVVDIYDDVINKNQNENIDDNEDDAYEQIVKEKPTSKNRPGKHVAYKPVPKIPTVDPTKKMIPPTQGGDDDEDKYEDVIKTPTKKMIPPTQGGDDDEDTYDDVIKTKPNPDDDDEDPYEDVVPIKPNPDDDDEDPYEDVVPMKTNSRNGEKVAIVKSDVNDELKQKLGTWKKNKPPAPVAQTNLTYEDDEDVYNEKVPQDPKPKELPKPRSKPPAQVNLAYEDDDDEDQYNEKPPQNSKPKELPKPKYVPDNNIDEDDDGDIYNFSAESIK